jgi:phosphatidylinositol alpha-1,6-mannosyltransferase
VNQLENTLMLINRLRKVNCDAVYLQLPCPVTKGLSLYPPKLQGRSVFVDYGDLWYSDETGPMHRTLNDVLVRHFSSCADKVSAATIGLKRKLESIVPKLEVHYAPCGVDMTLFDPLRIKPARLPKGRPIILFQGQVSLFTGCQYLVPMMRGLMQCGLRDAVMVVVGDGPYSTRLREEVAMNRFEGQIVLVGRKPHHLIPSYIAAADICLAPFPTRGDIEIGVFPIKVVEYMAMGKVAIVSGAPSAKDMLTSGYDGFYAPTSDFPRIISCLWNDPRQVEDIGDRARETAKTKFDWAVIVRSLVNFWFR